MNNNSFHSLSLKNKVFLLTSLLTILLVFIFTWSELRRWKELNRSYTAGKGNTLVRTISPLILDYINNNDSNSLAKLAKSITSSKIEANDIISIEILDKKKNKITESAPKQQYRLGTNFYFPPSIVVENPLFNEKDDEIGFIHIVFSNDYFIDKGNEVLTLALISLVIGLVLSFYISSDTRLYH